MRATWTLPALGLLSALVLGGQAPATAVAAPDGPATSSSTSSSTARGLQPYGRTLVNHTKKTDKVRYSDKIGQAQAGSAGINVQITKTSAATRSIGYGFGVSKAFVAGQLNISTSSSVGVNVGCSKTVAKKGRWLVAYSVGSIHRYRIKSVTKVMSPYPHQEVTYSDWMRTYNPYQTAISCRVQAKP